MRNLAALRPDQPSFPLLESADLPNAEDWSVLESLHCNDAFDSDDTFGSGDDQFATLSVARSFDD